jgi:hypothetical protein
MAMRRCTRLFGDPAGYNCEVDGCLPVESRAATDCDDGNDCTGATCSSASGCEYHSVNCADSTYACDDNICDPLADPVCDRLCQYNVNVYACPSPGLPCDYTTGCYPSEVCSVVPGQVCEPSHGGCVGPTSCVFQSYGLCNDANNCPTNIKSLAECEAAIHSLHELHPPVCDPNSGICNPVFGRLLFISYSGLYRNPDWDGESEYNEDGSCFVVLTGWGLDQYYETGENICSALLGDLYKPELNSGYIEHYDPDETVNCYSCY